MGKMRMERKKKKEEAPKRFWYSDLAIEQKERFPGEGGEIPGVTLDRVRNEGTKTETVTLCICNEQGAEIMQKPIGTYITIEGCHFQGLYHQDALLMEELSRQLGRLLPEDCRHILAVGLGNGRMTADALGTMTIARVQANEHLMEEFPEIVRGITTLCPGVKSQTGMETFDVIQAVVQKMKPDVLLVIDSLAARDVKRLATTIQLSDAGIIPGSGVGNHQRALCEKELGIPVLSIGVPMVVGTATIAHQTLSAILEVMYRMDQTRRVAQTIEHFEETETIGLMKELLPDMTADLYVMPKDADELQKEFAQMIAGAIMQLSFRSDTEEETVF